MRVLSRPVAGGMVIFLSMLLLPQGALAQVTDTPAEVVSGFPTPEEVRRVVERAMAAVAEAEARAERVEAVSSVETRRLEERIEELEAELARFEGMDTSALAAARMAAAEARDALAESQTRAADLELRLADAANELAVLRDSAALLALTERQRDAWAETAAAYAALIEDLGESISAARGGLDIDYSETAALLTAERDEWEETASALSRANEEWAASYAEMDSAYRAELAARAESEAILIGEIGELMDAVSEVRGAVSGMSDEMARARELIDGLEEENEGLRRELADLRADTRAAALEALLVERDEELAALRAVLAGSPEAAGEGEGSAEEPGEEPGSSGVTAPPGPGSTVVVEPAEVEEAAPAPEPFVAGAPDINTSPESELAAVREIGPGRAAAIVWFRENIGPFETLEDLRRVPGFNAERVEALRGRINVTRR